MAGQIITIVPPRLFDFTGLAINQSMDIVLQKNIDVSRWSDAALMLRANDFDVTGGYVYLQAFYVSPTADDPGKEFVSQQSSGIFLELYSGLTTPQFQTSGLGTPLGSALKIVVTGSRTQAGTLTAVFSVDMKVTNYFPL